MFTTTKALQYYPKYKLSFSPIQFLENDRPPILKLPELIIFTDKLIEQIISFLETNCSTSAFDLLSSYNFSLALCVKLKSGKLGEAAS